MVQGEVEVGSDGMRCDGKMDGPAVEDIDKREPLPPASPGDRGVSEQCYDGAPRAPTRNVPHGSFSVSSCTSSFFYPLAHIRISSAIADAVFLVWWHVG